MSYIYPRIIRIDGVNQNLATALYLVTMAITVWGGKNEI